MLVVRASAESLTKTRLAPSPATDVLAWLRLAVHSRQHPLFGPPGPAARQALSNPDVALVAALVPPPGSGHVPDLLTPPPPAGAWGQLLDQQIGLIDATSDAVVAAQVTGRRPAAVRAAVEAGTFARRAAAGLFTFWKEALADEWTALQATVAADLDYRCRLMGARGLGGLLNSLPRGISWVDSEMHIAHRLEASVNLENAPLVLAPVVLTSPYAEFQLADHTESMIAYPVGGQVDARRDPTIVKLLGRSRAAILAGLDAPRSTTELAYRHRLALATVSHHLGVLLDAGLVSRARHGRIVHYRRTERGDALVEQ